MQAIILFFENHLENCKRVRMDQATVNNRYFKISGTQSKSLLFIRFVASFATQFILLLLLVPVIYSLGSHHLTANSN